MSKIIPFTAFGGMTVAPSDEEASPDADSLVEHTKAASNVSEVGEGTDDILVGEEDGESGTGEAVDDDEDTSSTVAGSGSGDLEAVWPHDEEYIVEYSLEYGFLRLSPGMDRVDCQVNLMRQNCIKSYLIFV